MCFEQYKIASIRNLDGADRLDGRYPLRVGRTCDLVNEPETGKCLYIEWRKNADGSPYSGLCCNKPRHNLAIAVAMT